MAWFQAALTTLLARAEKLLEVVSLLEYSATDPTLTTGQSVNARCDYQGKLLVSLKHIKPMSISITEGTITLSSNPHILAASTTGGCSVDIEGTYKIQLSGAASYINQYMCAGLVYPLVVSRIWATGSPSGAKFNGYIASDTP